MKPLLYPLYSTTQQRAEIHLSQRKERDRRMDKLDFISAQFGSKHCFLNRVFTVKKLKEQNS